MTTVIPPPTQVVTDSSYKPNKAWYDYWRSIVSVVTDALTALGFSVGQTLGRLFSPNDALAKQILLLDSDPGNHPGFNHAPLVVDTNPKGSLSGSPDSSDAGIIISAYKQGWPQNAASDPGEIDCLSIVGRQSGNGAVTSDLSGWVVNLVNIAGCGFIAASEGVIESIDQTTFLPVQAMSYSLCSIAGYPPGVLNNGTAGFGLILSASYGANNSALFLRQFPGSTGGTWANAIEIESDNATTFQVSPLGNTRIVANSAIPAGGTQSLGLRMSSTPNFGVFFGSGPPTLGAAKGSLYLRSDGTGTNDRMYVNTNGSTTWTAVVTVA